MQNKKKKSKPRLRQRESTKKNFRFFSFAELCMTLTKKKSSVVVPSITKINSGAPHA